MSSRSESNRRKHAARTITDEQKIYELSKIWKEAEYNFAFWDKVDIDWDEEYRKFLPRVLAAKDAYDYYRELRMFVAMLFDGHTDVSFPEYVWQDAQYFSAFPVYLFRFGEDITVICVSEEYRDRIPLYSVLKKIDDADAAEYVRENCYPYIWHANESACGKNAMTELMYGRAGSSSVFTFEKDGPGGTQAATASTGIRTQQCSLTVISRISAVKCRRISRHTRRGRCSGMI